MTVRANPFSDRVPPLPRWTSDLPGSCRCRGGHQGGPHQAHSADDRRGCQHKVRRCNSVPLHASLVFFVLTHASTILYPFAVPVSPTSDRLVLVSTTICRSIVCLSESPCLSHHAPMILVGRRFNVQCAHHPSAPLLCQPYGHVLAGLLPQRPDAVLSPD